MEKLILKTTLVSIVFFGIGFIFIYFVKGTFTDGQVLNSSDLNQLSPSGAVIAFNLTTCPTGWKPADGTAGTPDLRGQFIRGLNSFNNGASTRTDGKQDIDGVSRILGSYQGDEIKSHTHSLNTRMGGTSHSSGVYPSSAGDGTLTNQGGNAIISSGGTETRPKNVALIYCVKE